MKRSPVSTLERFVRRVRRRWVVLRAVESAGVGAAIGCAAALALVPVLLWRDQPAIGVALTLVAVSGAAGLMFGLTRRPTLLAAAVEADRQLALHDLLASGLASRHATDQWSGAVIAQAEARCRNLSPDAILLNRLGVRAWSGIGLAAALVMTLSLLSSRPEPLSASDSARLAGTTAPRAPAVRERMVVGDRDVNNARGATADASPSRSDPSEATGEDSSAARITSGENDLGSSTGSSGGGLGAARTDDAAVRDRTTPHDSSPGAPDSAEAGDQAGGGRAGDGGPGERLGERGEIEGTGANRPSARPIDPWSSPSWPDARRDARDAVENGRVPDAYRELIRGYFDPE